MNVLDGTADWILPLFSLLSFPLDLPLKGLFDCFKLDRWLNMATRGGEHFHATASLDSPPRFSKTFSLPSPVELEILIQNV